MKRKLSQVLLEVDPNLNIVLPHRRKYRTTKADWDNAGGVACPSCGKEILKTYGPFKQCHRCFLREKGIFLEEVECPRCGGGAAKVTTLSNGLQGEKVICPHCGTFSV